jgi:tRNA threonylcarbamoyladenosine biosynthesis protein TsaB
MANILNIHTATETAIVNLTNGHKVVSTLTNHETKEHASFLHIAIQKILEDQKINVKELSSIGVTSGPGSYTGIRVGLAAAKGLCYALKIPMITFSSLELLARSAIDLKPDPKALYCSMIDARRMEIYTAMYDVDLQEKMPPSAMIIDENSFSEILAGNKIYFIGSGSDKFKQLIKNENALFIPGDISSKSIAEISWEKYKSNKFQNIFDAHPLYIKDFHNILEK